MGNSRETRRMQSSIAVNMWITLAVFIRSLTQLIGQRSVPSLGCSPRTPENAGALPNPALVFTAASDRNVHTRICRTCFCRKKAYDSAPAELTDSGSGTT